MLRDVTTEVLPEGERQADASQADREAVAEQSLLWLKNPIFAAAGAHGCRALARDFPARLHPPDTVVAAEGAPGGHMHVLLRGTVRVFHRMPDGREAIFKLMQAPMTYGDMEVFHGVNLMISVAALDEILVGSIPAERFFEFLHKHPAAMFEHLKHFAAAFCLTARNERQLFFSLEQRIANVMLSYADLCGKQEDGDLVITKALSQQVIAQSVGAVRRSVAQVIARWIKAGFISKREQYLVIHRPEPLEQLAGPIRDGLCFRMGVPLNFDGEQQLDAAEVELESAPMRLNLPRQRFPVDQELLVGRNPPCRVLIDDPDVSGQHCRIFRGATGCRFWLEDLGSASGTRVNDRDVKRGVLRDGDLIVVGGVSLRFRLVR